MTKVSLARICGLMSGRPDIQDPRSVEKERRWRMKREGIGGNEDGMGPRYGMGGLGWHNVREPANRVHR